MTDDAIIFLGLNPSASDEAQSLRKQGNKVIFIGKGKIPDRITHKKIKYNLSSRLGIENYIRTLGLLPAQNIKLVNAINTAGYDIKDELGEFVAILAKMEKTNKGPSRLVLSGHSIGNIFWGDNNGSLEIQNVKEIANTLLKAAALIEDLHISACYSGKERDLRSWRNVFPNVSTIWAYSGSAPGSYTGATIHLSKWDKATRGSKTALDRAIAEKTRKGQNVSVWSKKFGYQSKNSTAILDLLNRITNPNAERTYLLYFSGVSNVIDTQSGPLRNYYNDLQELVAHPLVTPTQISIYRPRLETTIRLIYFDKTIKKKFSSVYANEFNNAYRLQGKAQPNFSKLSRKECLAEIARFEQAAVANSSPEVTRAKELLVHGLKNLESAYIPENWI